MVLPHCDEVEARGELWDAEVVTFLHGVLEAGDAYQEIGNALRVRSDGRRWKRVGVEWNFETVAPPWNAAEPAIPAATATAPPARARPGPPGAGSAGRSSWA